MWLRGVTEGEAAGEILRTFDLPRAFRCGRLEAGRIRERGRNAGAGEESAMATNGRV